MPAVLQMWQGVGGASRKLAESAAQVVQAQAQSVRRTGGVDWLGSKRAIYSTFGK